MVNLKRFNVRLLELKEFNATWRGVDSTYIAGERDLRCI